MWSDHVRVYISIIGGYRALQVICHRLVAWLSSCGECYHGNASLNQPAPNLIKTLYNLVR